MNITITLTHISLYSILSPMGRTSIITLHFNNIIIGYMRGLEENQDGLRRKYKMRFYNASTHLIKYLK